MADTDSLFISATAPAYWHLSAATNGTVRRSPSRAPTATKLKSALHKPAGSSTWAPTETIATDMDTDLVRALHLIQELSEQVALNHKMAASLYSQSVTLKDKANNATSGYALRRFNVDISKEVFESVLERRNAQLIIENQTLLHENKQLNMLLNEYETTLETVVSKFRNHAVAADRHELTLTRHYETIIHTREAQMHSPDMPYNAQTSISISRITFLLRNLLKCTNGEATEPYMDHELYHPNTNQPFADLTELEGLVDRLGDDWDIQREIEIERLEKENEEIRKMLKIDPHTMEESGIPFDVDRYDYGRTIGLRRTVQQQPPSMTSTPPGGDLKLPWVENNGQQQQQQGLGGAGPHPSQHMTEFQPGMRMGSQVRRPGIIGGGGQQRGLFVSGGLASPTGIGSGNGRTSGLNLGIGPPPSGGGPPAIWSNPPAVSPAPPLVVERPWPGGPGLDLSR